MRPLPFQSIGNMPELRCKVIEVFPCFLWPQSNNRRYAKPDKEEDDTESELHIENDLDTTQLKAHKKILFEDAMLVHTRYNDEYCLQILVRHVTFLWWFRQTKILSS